MDQLKINLWNAATKIIANKLTQDDDAFGEVWLLDVVSADWLVAASFFTSFSKIFVIVLSTSLV